MTSLLDGQMELRADEADALVIGPGTAYRYPTDWVQWWAAPGVRTFDLERAGANGYVAGRDLLGKQATTLLVQILADDADDLRAKIDAWKAACAARSTGLVTLRANLLGETRLRYGRFRVPGEVRSRGRVTLGGFVVDGSAMFESLDALTYGDDLNTAATSRLQEGAGFTPPFTPPFTLGASVGGTVDAYNAGTMPAPWSAVLTGPLTYPTISHLTLGRKLSLAFSANGGVDLATGDTLTIDSATRSVLLNGTADRRSQLTVDSAWWDLAPGSNPFQLDADAGAGTLTVSWRDAYFS